MPESTVKENAVKHTPGPWRTTIPAHPITPLAAGDRMVLGVAFDGSERAIIDCVRGGSPEQADANARLISAAPEMLQALKDTLDYWEDTGFAECDEHCNCIVQSVQAAIAKAEGVR